MSNIPTKITQISKDFNIKSKDVLDTFKDLGIEKKSGGSVDADEFELFFHAITKKHQIKDLEAYRSGKATIKVAEEKKGPMSSLHCMLPCGSFCVNSKACCCCC